MRELSGLDSGIFLKAAAPIAMVVPRLFLSHNQFEEWVL
jgi:hypothetical protein